MRIFSMLFLATMFLTACGDDDPISAEVQMRMNVGDQEFRLGEVYNINGTNVQFDIASLYIYDVKIETDVAQFNNSNYALFQPGTLTYDLGTLEEEEATLSSISFMIGVDPVTNSQTTMDFTERPADDPLSEKNPSMHWSWNTGYKFVRFDGMADTDGDETVETPIAYHLGSDAMLNSIELTPNIALENGANAIEVSFDIAKVFEGVDFTTDLDTHTGNNLPLAEKIRDNFNTAVTVR